MHRFRRLLVFPVLLGVLLTVASFRLNTLPASAGSGLVTQNCSTVAASVTICTNTFAQTFSAGTSINIAFQGGAPGVNVTCNAPSGVTCTVGGGNSGATLVCQVTCQSGSSFVVVLPGGATQYFTMGTSAGAAAYGGPATTAYINPNPVGAITVGNPAPSVNVTVQTNPCASGGYQIIMPVSCSGYGSSYGGGYGGLCVGGSIPTNYGCTGASVIASPYTYSYAPLYGYGYGSNCGGYGSGFGFGYGGGYGGGCGNSCGYGYVYAGGCGSSYSGGCSGFVFSCGSFGFNNFNNNCGGFFGGSGGFNCNGFGGGFFNGFRNCNQMNSASCFIRQGGSVSCPGGTTFKFSGGVWGCF